MVQPDVSCETVVWWLQHAVLDAVAALACQTTAFPKANVQMDAYIDRPEHIRTYAVDARERTDQICRVARVHGSALQCTTCGVYGISTARMGVV